MERFVRVLGVFTTLKLVEAFLHAGAQVLVIFVKQLPCLAIRSSAELNSPDSTLLLIHS